LKNSPKLAGSVDIDAEAAAEVTALLLQEGTIVADLQAEKEVLVDAVLGQTPVQIHAPPRLGYEADQSIKVMDFIRISESLICIIKHYVFVVLPIFV
jgi:hypothetical protein